MVKFLKLAIIIVLIPLSLKSQSNVDEIKVYKKFLKAGTTNALQYAFRHPDEYANIIDTSKYDLAAIINLKDWEEMMNASKKKKHFQTKVSGIRLGGEMISSGKINYFIICNDNLIINLTEGYEYKINEKGKRLINLILNEISCKK
jgi:hypothetical protein